MLLLEYWKIIPRFPSYEVSYSQRVRHIRFKQIKNCYVCDGYFKMNLRSETGKYHKPYLHQLVGWTFVPNPDNKPELHHIDGVKYNNHPSNFEWLTKQEHKERSKELGQISHILKTDDVIFIRQTFWLHGKDKLAQQFGVADTTIIGVALGRMREDVDYPCHRDGLGIEKTIIDISTGIFYESAKELGDIIGMPAKEIRRRLNGERPNRTSYRYCTTDGIEETEPAPPEIRKKLKPIAKFDKEGVLIERFLDFKNVGDRTLRQRIGFFLEGRSGLVDGFVYKLIAEDGSFIEPPKFISNRKKRIPSLIPPNPSKEVIKYTQQGDFVQRFASIRDVARSLGIDRKNIQRVIIGGKSGRHYYKGFIYKFA